MNQNLAHEVWHWQDMKTARLTLKFQDSVLREVALSGGVVTIGRQPDNLLRIDNPLVSGHHARIFWQNNEYILEDNESFNGTYVNNRSIARAVLKNGDTILIGKHRIEFHDDASDRDEHSPSMTDRTTAWQAQVEKAAPPQLEPTMVMDAAKIKEMFAKRLAGSQPVPPSGSGSHVIICESRTVEQRKIGMVKIVAGRTDRRQYTLSGKLSVIGRSGMASIRLKRWFAPRVAASIHLREDVYFLVPAAKNIRMKINDAEVSQGQHELSFGDRFEVAGIVAEFGYEENG
jgi:pSer/pThr/pTyr-binding forkhead associated (FHA) protein